MSYFIPLTDSDPCPVAGVHISKPMEKVPDRYLVELYSQPWLKTRHPEVHAYIVRSAMAIRGLVLRKEDRK